MIPKTIHYCWFGRNPKPKLVLKCIDSWKIKCPDYQIIEWSEDNFDISSCPLYVRQAYAAKKWAFVTDYVRLKIIYDYGGIYLDTDVELIKNLDSLLDHPAFFGKEDEEYVATGLGFGAEVNNPVVYLMLKDYYDSEFLQKDGSINYITCPDRNTRSIRHLLEKSVVTNGIIHISNAVIYPQEYFCPLDWKTRTLKITDNTMSIHWYDASWLKEDQKNLKEYSDRRAVASKLLGRKLGHLVIRLYYSVFLKEKWNKIINM